MLDVDALSTMMAGIISEEVEKAVAPLNARIAEIEARPAGPQMDDVKGVVEIMISDAFVVKAAREIETQKQPDFAPMIEDAVGKAVAALPKPKDGEPGKDAAGIVDALKDSGELILTLEDGRLIRTGVRDGEKGNDGRDGADGKDGADGAGIADLLRDHDGNLVATFTDGRLKNLGPIQGKDGQNGRDGFELTDYDEWFEDDGRTLVRRFVVGEDFKEFRHQTVLPRYRGVYKDGEAYTRGDITTWGGHSWHCDKDGAGKPDAGDWSQMVKKGRDGKDAK